MIASQGGDLSKIGMKGIFYPGFRVNLTKLGVIPFRKGRLPGRYVTKCR